MTIRRTQALTYALYAAFLLSMCAWGVSPVHAQTDNNGDAWHQVKPLAKPTKHQRTPERLPLVSMKLTNGEYAWGCLKNEHMRSLYAVPDKDGTEWTFARKGYWCERNLSSPQPTPLEDDGKLVSGEPFTAIPLKDHGCAWGFSWDESKSSCSISVSFSGVDRMSCSPLAETGTTQTMVCWYKPTPPAAPTK